MDDMDLFHDTFGFVQRRGIRTNRRTVDPRVVRPELPPRIPGSPELQPLLDGIGQPGADANRKMTDQHPRSVALLLDWAFTFSRSSSGRDEGGVQAHQSEIIENLQRSPKSVR